MQVHVCMRNKNVQLCNRFREVLGNKSDTAGVKKTSNVHSDIS